MAKIDCKEKVQSALSKYDTFQMARTLTGARDEATVEESVTLLYRNEMNTRFRQLRAERSTLTVDDFLDSDVNLTVEDFLIQALRKTNMTRPANTFESKEAAEYEKFYWYEKYQLWIKNIW